MKLYILSTLLILFIFKSCNYVSRQSTKELTDNLSTRIEEAERIGQNNPEECIDRITKLRNSAKEINYQEGVLNCERVLMVLAFNRTEFKDVIEYSNKVKELATELRNFQILSDAYRLGGLSLIEIGFNDEGYRELQKSLLHARKIPSEDSKNYRISLIYDNIGGYFNNIGKKEKAIEFKLISLKFAKKMKKAENLFAKNQMIAFQYMNLGIIYSQEEKYDQAERYLNLALELHENPAYKIDIIDKMTIYLELSILYNKRKQPINAIKFGEKSLALEKTYQAPALKIQTYESILNAYTSLNNKDSILKYMSLHKIWSDSVNTLEKKNIKYSAKHLLKKQKANSNLLLKNSVLIICTLFSGIGLLLYLLYTQKNKIWKHKYESEVVELKSIHMPEKRKIKASIIDEDVTKKQNMVPIDTMNSILDKLRCFEDSKEYLRNDMNLPSLANFCDTNTKYMSEVIKLHKAKNFNTYINDLRINHITFLLDRDPVFRKYKIGYLASYCGYSSREIFVTVFKKQMGVPPSSFIEELEKKDLP